MRNARWRIVVGGWWMVLAISGSVSAAEPDHGPLRKLGRGLANVALGWTDIPVTIGRVHQRDGAPASAFYGPLVGTRNALGRTAVGVLETVTFFMPLHHRTFEPMLLPEFPSPLNSL